ncbi:hypothetical protein LJC19_02155 [Oxalobacter sp. OttesenSCG-928-P03]|nr:hypothetical protein [Oxalobacter sp. OttesenSCG-928-P03]
MTKTPLHPYEQASYDLTFFRESLVAERRRQRDLPEQRKSRRQKDSMPDRDVVPEGMH